MSRIGDFITRACVTMATRWPWAVLAVALVLTVLAGFAAMRLTINTSTREILSAELPFRKADEAYRGAFPQDDVAVVVIDAGTSAEAQKAARDLVERLKQRTDLIELVELASASPYFEHYGLMFLEPDQIRAIGEQIGPARRIMIDLAKDPSLRGMAKLLGLAADGVAESAAPPSLAHLLTEVATTVRDQAEGKPAEMQWSQLFRAGPDRGGTREIIQLNPVLNDRSINRAGPAIDALHAAIGEAQTAYPDVRFRVTGEPVLRQQELNDAFSSALYASGLSLILVAAILTIGIRSGRTIAALLIALLVGAIWTAGLASVSVGRLNLISVAFMVLFFGLGIDFGTHLSLRHLEAARKGTPFAGALKTAVAGEGPSISLSALCAALAFLSFVPTPYVGLAEFGIISAFGMLVALVITFTVLPALLSVLRAQPSARAVQRIGITRLVNRHYRLILVVAAIVTVAAAFMATRAEIDTNPLNLQNQNTEAVRTYRDLATDPETSPYALNVLAPNIEAAGDLSARLSALPDVANVRWIGNFVPRDQDAKLAALAAVRERLGESFFAATPPQPAPTDAELADAFAKIKASADRIAATPADNPVDPSIPAAGRELAAALSAFTAARGADADELRKLGDALTREMPPIVADLRQTLNVERPVVMDDIPADMRSDWVSADGQFRLRVAPKHDLATAAAMKQFSQEVQSVAPEAAGAPASVTGAGQAILLSFAEAIAYTVIAIVVVVAALRRRLSDVLLVLLPLAVASLWIVAGSAVLNLPFNFANVIVIPLLIGLGVASSIHMVGRAREVGDEADRNDGEGEVLDTSTPLAVLITQLNTVAAFATLSLAKHEGLFSMGVLLGLAISFVLIVSLIVLPAFMIAIGIGARPAQAKIAEG